MAYVYHYYLWKQLPDGRTQHSDGMLSVARKIDTVQRHKEAKDLLVAKAAEGGFGESGWILASLSFLHETESASPE